MRSAFGARMQAKMAQKAAEAGPEEPDRRRGLPRRQQGQAGRARPPRSGLQYQVIRQGTGPTPKADRQGARALQGHAARRHRVRQLLRSRPAGRVRAQPGHPGLDRGRGADAGRQQVQVLDPVRRSPTARTARPSDRPPTRRCFEVELMRHRRTDASHRLRHRLRRPGHRHLPGGSRQPRRLRRHRRGEGRRPQPRRDPDLRAGAGADGAGQPRRRPPELHHRRRRRRSTHGDIIFIAVGTPPDEDGSADLQYVLAVARTIGKHLQRPAVVVNKSTVPVGTADKVRAAIAAELAGARRRRRLRRRLQPGIPQGRRRGQGLHAPGPDRDRHRQRRARSSR